MAVTNSQMKTRCQLTHQELKNCQQKKGQTQQKELDAAEKRQKKPTDNKRDSQLKEANKPNKKSWTQPKD
jgi:hypothetical protein